jgi:tetratricopeptide (TPR) repeat protein
LKTLAGLSGLILIDASNTDVADGSLENAAEWSNLRYLSLNDTAVTDSGLEYLAPVRGLKGLSLINTAVTADGVETLKRRLPDCVIVAKSTTDSAQTRVFEEEGETLEYSQDLSVSATRGSINQQLQQMLNLAASQPQLAVHLSRVYSEAGQWEETAQILATANVVDPSNEDVNLALGEAYARLGRSNDAILHLEQVVGANEARYVVGMIVYEDTLKSCERYFGDVAAADPEFKAARIRHERIQKELSQMSSHRGTSPTSGADRNVDDSEGPEIIPSAPLRTATRSRMLDADDSH